MHTWYFVHSVVWEQSNWRLRKIYMCVTLQLVSRESGIGAETEVEEGDVLVAPWSVVKPFLIKGYVELL